MCELPNEIIHGIFERMLLDDHRGLPAIEAVSKELALSAWEDVRLTIATRLVKRWRIWHRWLCLLSAIEVVSLRLQLYRSFVRTISTLY